MSIVLAIIEYKLSKRNTSNAEVRKTKFRKGCKFSEKQAILLFLQYHTDHHRMNKKITSGFHSKILFQGYNSLQHYNFDGVYLD